MMLTSAWSALSSSAFMRAFCMTFTANWSFVRRLIASFTSPNWPEPSTLASWRSSNWVYAGSPAPAPSVPDSS